MVQVFTSQAFPAGSTSLTFYVYSQMPSGLGLPGSGLAFQGWSAMITGFAFTGNVLQPPGPPNTPPVAEVRFWVGTPTTANIGKGSPLTVTGVP